MKKVAVLLAEGYEEGESLFLIDILRRAQIECHSVSVDGNETVTGGHPASLARQAELLPGTGAADRLDEIIAWEINGGRLTRAYSLRGLSAQAGALAVSPDLVDNVPVLGSAPLFGGGGGADVERHLKLVRKQLEQIGRRLPVLALR